MNSAKRVGVFIALLLLVGCSAAVDTSGKPVASSPSNEPTTVSQATETVSAVAETTKADAHWLVGRWEGPWSSPRGFSGTAWIDVTEVAGKSVKGRIQVNGQAPWHNRIWPLKGTVDGERVEVGLANADFVHWDLHRQDGDTLTGAAVGTGSATITLKRR